MSFEEKDDDQNDSLKFFCLGGGNEVGRSCHIIEFKGKTVMLDAGVHPGFSGLNCLPFYDEYDLSKIDILLISHFHVDHAASLPFVMHHTAFRGRVFMTHPTKAIYRWLLNDFTRLSLSDEDGNGLGFTEEELASLFDKIETVDYHLTVEIDGIKFTAYHAGHVLGAAMYFVEIGGMKVLFTGDYSRSHDRHLHSAEVPPERPDILICESTFGTATFDRRDELETRLTRIIHSTVTNGGRVLLPSFALGRAQELMLILEEYWAANSDLDNIPIYFVLTLAKKWLTVYKTYLSMMNEDIQRKAKEENTNPFQFKYIRTLRSLSLFEDFGPCVVIASPGMLQNGASRELLERWAPDPKNALIITGYSVNGTLAKSILLQPSEIPSANNPDIMIPRRLTVDEISFAAHVDYEENSEFILLVDPKNIVLVHGELNPMGRLKSALLSKYARFKKTKNEVKVYTPKNCEDLRIKLQGIRVAKALGLIAALKPKPADVLTGVLVSKNFDLHLMKVDDLREFSGLTTTVVKEKQTVRVHCGRDLIHWHLSQMFGYVEVVTDTDDSYELRIMNDIAVTLENDICTVKWPGGLINDTIADSVIAILLSVDSSPASVKLTASSHEHSHGHSHNHSQDTKKSPAATNASKEVLALRHADSAIGTRIHRVIGLLKAQFGDSFSVNEEKTGGKVVIGLAVADINFLELIVDCKTVTLRSRIEQILNRATELAAPLAQKTKVV